MEHRGYQVPSEPQGVSLTKVVEGEMPCEVGAIGGAAPVFSCGREELHPNFCISLLLNYVSYGSGEGARGEDNIGRVRHMKEGEEWKRKGKVRL